jgi:Kef-type K+ transport system membrane component KefB
METPDPAVSLFWIALCAVLAPLLAGFVPRKMLPEVVLLLFLGVLIGPNVLGLASVDEAIGLLQELGLGMLFLMAGYEVEVRELTGPGGRRALVTWLIGLGAAFLTVWLVGLSGAIKAEIAVAIALTSTALGTLLPILKDSGMLNTRFGNTVLHHGAIGELGPVVAMAIFLGARKPGGSLIVLLAFAAVAVFMTLPWTRLRHGTTRVMELVRAGSETTGQTTVRLTVLLLISLLVLAAAFDLDTVLGAFAAGFILRRALPDGDPELEHKLNGLAFGLLIPVFFVTSGMAIDPAAVAARPLGLVAFIVMILIVRGFPVYLAGRLQTDPATGARVFDTRDSVRLGLYGATGLPIIVAVTSTAVSAGVMSPSNASLLVAGGALTVLALPMTATLLARPAGPSAS